MAEDLEQVYRETFPILVRFLYRKLWNTDRAEEVAQEAFARAVQHRPKKVRAWVFIVASNLARDAQREEAIRTRRLTLLKSEPAPAPPTPDVEVERGEELARVREALQGLSPREREVLLLWDAGHSYGEIAQHTGLAPKAVGTTLARARRHLVDLFNNKGAGHAKSA